MERDAARHCSPPLASVCRHTSTQIVCAWSQKNMTLSGSAGRDVTMVVGASLATLTRLSLTTLDFLVCLSSLCPHPSVLLLFHFSTTCVPLSGPRVSLSGLVSGVLFPAHAVWH